MKLILGTAQFSDDYGAFKKNIIRDQCYKKIFQILNQQKISYLDTAIAYKNSEKIIGNYFNRRLKVFSKISFSKKINRKNVNQSVKNSLNKSLKKLKAKNLHCLYIHHVKDLREYKKEIVNCLLMLKKEKIVKNIGISVYSPEEVTFALKYFKPDFVQFPLNIFDQRFIEKNFLKKLKSLKIKLVARSCFLQGLLLNRYFSHINFKSLEKKKFMNFMIFVKKKKLTN